MIKRIFDIVASGLAMLLLGPLLIPVCILLRLTGEGEIFYRQLRIGRYGKPFNILKFATMLRDSPNMAGGDITVGRDPRILPMGRFLRSTKINELPQLANVFMGDMSIIGPRPLTPRVAAMFPADHWKALGDVRPGLSGIGSVVFRDEEKLLAGAADRNAVYASDIVPYKAALERWYAAHQSLWVDIQLILMTIAAVLHVEVNPKNVFRDLPNKPQVMHTHSPTPADVNRPA